MGPECACPACQRHKMQDEGTLIAFFVIMVLLGVGSLTAKLMGALG